MPDNFDLSELKHSQPPSVRTYPRFNRYVIKVIMAAPRVISNSSTFKGWLESNGLDDMVLNPCGCIFGETEEPQIPIPGQRKYANQRSASARGRGGSMRNGQAGRHGGSVRNGGRGLSRQQSVMSRTSMPPLPEDANYVPEEPSSKSPFAVLFGSAFAG